MKRLFWVLQVKDCPDITLNNKIRSISLEPADEFEARKKQARIRTAPVPQ